MCLYPRQPLKVEISSIDIICFKTLKFLSNVGVYVSPFMNEPYCRGEIKMVEAFSRDVPFCKDEAFAAALRFTTVPPFPVLRVGEGLHAWIADPNELELDCIMVRVVIPAGTPHILGREGNDVVSLCLRVEDALSGPPSHVEAFNRRQVTYESSN